MLMLGLTSAAHANKNYQLIDDIRLVPVEEIDAYESSENMISVDIEGYLPDDCYGEPRVKFKRGKFKNQIYVKVFSYVRDGQCAQVITPFSITANLGTYEDGSHTVIVQPGTQWEMRDTVVVD